ncbi:4-hydroxy-tetrahydrodipicolinate synthase [Parasphaerochaeta coccoides]|uniref:4-hydroxy-tetrahydrodipicolinate synthase n=1 Tax=Parasphaerochaeta coccoides (strain ATCC BAA-1237 / DSM 17374 / SPN1) TaxID=760011 RepID=F4GHA5_PARC1|nr:4-hydroxy-tetrahydrodipicolinate synthase [Parasphaerochaeta coccoides]AEC02004.1 dihydrodipicolinate synthase [Parasphaerochaeta coccoides DSM 17374]
MTYEEFRGVHTALITPFTATGEVDEVALARLVEYQIGSGISGLVPCGTTGESPTLTHPEHDRVIELVIEYAAGRVPVIAGTGSNATSEAIRLSLHAEQAGADAVLLVNPYYNKPTQKGLYLHFKAIAEAISLPCILYNIKGRTGVNLETETLTALARDCHNIVAVKEASGDLNQMKDVIAHRRHGFRVLSGDDNMVLDLIEAGGDGVISVASNLFPRLMSTMVAQALAGNRDGSRALGAQLDEFFHSCFLETNPIPIKTAMAMCGWCNEEFRLPMCSLEKEEHRLRLQAAVDKLKSVAPEAFRA